MLVTAIQIRRLENTGNKIQGIANIILDDMIAIHDIKILKNGDSLFLAMPSRPTKSNTFKDIVHPINSGVRQVLERLIFAAYEESDKMHYGHLELLLREERKEANFFELAIEDYENGRITAQVIPTQHTTNDTPIKKATYAQQKKQPVIDEDLLKWLEG